MPAPAVPAPLAALPEARRRDLIRSALHFWREGDAEIRAPHRTSSRPAYERAIDRVLRGMERLTTMEALLTHYYVDRTPLMRLTELACRDVRSRRALSRIWVRDAAFWRRFRAQMSPS